jgi:signal peptidase I
MDETQTEGISDVELDETEVAESGEPTNGEPARDEGSGIRQFLLDIVETLVLAALLFFTINAVSARIRVDGSSMQPTLQDGEYVLVYKLAYRLGSPQRGDVIVFHYPRDPQQEYIKRVIGLPGDQVDIVNGQVYVNEQLIDEPYIAASPRYGPGSWSVPEDALFVLGDNRNNSNDSHQWGTVPFEYVVGKALFVYWPLDEFGAIQQAQLLP